MEYKFLRGNSNGAQKLHALINKHLKEGWELYGNPVMCVDPLDNTESRLWVGQALIKDPRTRKFGK